MQKAIVISEVGKPAIAINRRIPQPKTNELLLRTKKTRDAGLFSKQPNQVLGHELAGQVIALGEGRGANSSGNTAQFALGERVVAQANFYPGQVLADAGALQQYAVVDAWFAARIDGAPGLSDEEAVAIASFVALFGWTGVGLGLPIPGISAIASGISYSRGWPGSGASSRRHAGYAAPLAQIQGLTGDGLVYALDTVNLVPGHRLGLAALSGTKRGCLVTLNRGAGYEYRMKVGFKGDGVVRPLPFRSVDGLDAVTVNRILDGYRDGRGEKVVLRV
ncbi:hypothetical protein BDV12DRAFT_189490 [Aspergillus spectabilis]